MARGEELEVAKSGSAGMGTSVEGKEGFSALN